MLHLKCTSKRISVYHVLSSQPNRQIYIEGTSTRTRRVEWSTATAVPQIRKESLPSLTTYPTHEKSPFVVVKSMTRHNISHRAWSLENLVRNQL